MYGTDNQGNLLTIDPATAAGTIIATGGPAVQGMATQIGTNLAPPVNLNVIEAGTGRGSVTGSGISCPTTCSADYQPGTSVTLAAVAESGSAFVGWSGDGCSGTGTCSLVMASDVAVTATFIGPPASTTRPHVAGGVIPHDVLSCSPGSWTNDPTAYAYQWYRNGAPLAGSTASSYTLGTLDEGTTLTCGVTASNAAGQGSAMSNSVKIPIPHVARCPGATGTMTGTTIGQIMVGMTRTRADYLYRHHSDRGRQYEDFFCLTPIGIRVGYASPTLLASLAKRARASLQNRVVWASTSNPHYLLDGVHAGESITVASEALRVEAPIHIGLNYWYLAHEPRYTAVLKVRGRVVEELGIATSALTRTRKAQVLLMHSFY